MTARFACQIMFHRATAPIAFVFACCVFLSPVSAQRSPIGATDANVNGPNSPVEISEPMRLPQPSKAVENETRSGGLDSTGRMVMSLAVVLGVFFLVAWFSRKRMSLESELPVDVVEVLGHFSLGPRDSARLIRVGAKLILVASTPQGLSTLTEVSDPAEVDELTRLCESTSGSSAWREQAA